MRIRDVMNKAMVVEECISLKDAAKIMSDKEIGSIIIMKKDKIVGMITERDILRNVDKLNSKICSIMSKEVITIDESESVENASLIMASHKIKRLPVLKKEKLVGIITATDILANSETLNDDFFIE